jgi:phosphopantetheine--protein transferase-like protein
VATLGVGVDVVDVARFALALARRPRLAERVFTERERADTRLKPERLAARFAAKEAVMKSLGVGLGATPLQSIEVRRAPSGAPSLHLAGAAAQLAHDRGVASWHISLTHTAQTAAAIVIASSEPDHAG